MFSFATFYYILIYFSLLNFEGPSVNLIEGQGEVSPPLVCVCIANNQLCPAMYATFQVILFTQLIESFPQSVYIRYEPPLSCVLCG